NHLGELAEPVDGDGIGDLFHAGEVLVQDRLAVFDLGGQPTCGDGVPAFGLGQLASRCDDQPSTGGPLAFAPILDGHTRRISQLEKLATLLTRMNRRVSVASSYE